MTKNKLDKEQVFLLMAFIFHLLFLKTPIYAHESTPVADACWCMAKPIQYCKVKKINKIKKIKKKKARIYNTENK